VKGALEEGTGVVSNRITAIKLADKSEFGWQTVNEYLSDELVSDSDDEKRMYRVKRRAEKKKIRISVIVSLAPSLVEAPSLPFGMCPRIRKEPLRAISGIQNLPDAWIPVSR